MIVGKYFEGDDDTAVAWRQHDVYHQALGIMVGTCMRYASFARKLLRDEKHEDWGSVNRYDHRTIQWAHDLLAAAWRFQNDFRQQPLSFDPAHHGEGQMEELWLAWLRREVESWIDAPQLVRSVMIILTHQNQTIGSSAEIALSRDLVSRFAAVPWEKSKLL
jgi:hypothetical protein